RWLRGAAKLRAENFGGSTDPASPVLPAGAPSRAGRVASAAPARSAAGAASPSPAPAGAPAPPSAFPWGSHPGPTWNGSFVRGRASAARSNYAQSFRPFLRGRAQYRIYRRRVCERLPALLFGLAQLRVERDRTGVLRFAGPHFQPVGIGRE